MRMFSVPETLVHHPWAALAAACLTLGLAYQLTLAPAPTQPPKKPLQAAKNETGPNPRLDFACQFCDPLHSTNLAKSAFPNTIEPRTRVEAAKLAERFSAQLPKAEQTAAITGTEASASSDPAARVITPVETEAAKPATASGPIMRLALSRDTRTGARLAFPFDITSSSADSRGGNVLIAHVPEGVAFSKGRQTGPGLWMLPVADVPSTELVIDPKAPVAFDLTFMLLNREGTVVSGVDMAVTMVDIRPSERPDRPDRSERAASPPSRPVPRAFASGRAAKAAPQVVQPVAETKPAAIAPPSRAPASQANLLPNLFAPKPFPIPAALGTTFSESPN
jgi:hypothetical protein